MNFLARFKRLAFRKRRPAWQAPADPDKIIWIKPEEVRLQLREDKQKRAGCGPGIVLGGNWDKDVKPKTAENTKYKSIREHFVDGVPWEETDLFKNRYLKRLRRQGPDAVKGCRTPEELLSWCEKKIDGLYQSIKKDGILLPGKDRSKVCGKRVRYLYVHIGRSGNFIGSSDGNHRLCIAKLLKIKLIPCKVWWRHQAWQELRERLYRADDRERQRLLKRRPGLFRHPDLADILLGEKD